MIVDGHRRGVCDKNGKTLQGFPQEHHFVPTKQFSDNYDKIDWSDNG